MALMPSFLIITQFILKVYNDWDYIIKIDLVY
jgi:hypothetical protein